MKSTFKFIVFILFALVAQSCSETTAGTQSKPNVSAKQIEVQSMLQEEKRIREEQQGICDTCKTAIKSVILENRLIAEEILQENGRLKVLSDSIKAEKQRYVALLNRLRQNREQDERDFQEYTSLQNSNTLVSDNHSYRTNGISQNQRRTEYSANKP